MTNIIALALQLLVVIAAGAALAAIFRLRLPRTTLAYWQAVLVLCLLLPFVQPWHQTVAPFLDATSDPVAVVTMDVPVRASAVTGPVSTGPAVASLLLFTLLAGMVLRTGWLAIGAIRLWHLRRTATRIVPPLDAFLTAEDRLGIHADVYVSDRIAGPVTFGFTHPVIILTPGVLGMPRHVQEAIAYHELLHVRRNDWVYELAEEGVRTIFWCHPAVRWLIGRIQLSRELVVDLTVIELTESRDRYIDALLQVALTKSRLTLVPAPLFLRRSLLKKRVAHILQETSMTLRRLIASLTASAAALALVAIVVVRAFPLEAQTQPSTNNGEPLQIVQGGEHLLHASLPEYPRRAIEQRVAGDVLLDLVIDDRGEVSDARVVSGPDELRRAALESALSWHYSPASVSTTTVQATLRFRLPAASNQEGGYRVASGPKEEKEWDSPAQRAEHVMMELRRALEDPAASDVQKEEWKKRLVEEQEVVQKIRAERERFGGRSANGTLTLVQIRSERVTPDVVKEVVDRAGLTVGAPITEDAAKRVGKIAGEIDEHLRANFRNDGKGGLILTLVSQ